MSVISATFEVDAGELWAQGKAAQSQQDPFSKDMSGIVLHD